MTVSSGRPSRRGERRQRRARENPRAVFRGEKRGWRGGRFMRQSWCRYVGRLCSTSLHTTGRGAGSSRLRGRNRKASVPFSRGVARDGRSGGSSWLDVVGAGLEWLLTGTEDNARLSQGQRRGPARPLRATWRLPSCSLHVAPVVVRFCLGARKTLVLCFSTRWNSFPNSATRASILFSNSRGFKRGHTDGIDGHMGA